MNRYGFPRWGAPPARSSFWFHKSPSAILLLASVIIGVLWLIPVKPTQARPNLTYNRLVWTGAQVVTQQPTGGGTNSNWTKDEDYFVINLDPVVPKAELIRVEIESQPIPGEPICQSTAGGYPPVRPLYLNTSGKWQGAFDANVVDPIEKIVIHCNTYNGGNASRKMLVAQVTLVVSTVPTSTPVPTNTPTRTPTPQPTGTPIRPTNTPFPTPTPERYTIAGHILDEQGTPAVEDIQFIVMDHSTGSPMPRVPLIDTTGSYTLSGFTNGSYTVQPELTSPLLSAQSFCVDIDCQELYLISPISRTYISLSGNQTNQDYTLIRTPGYTITGQISETITSTTHPISGVTILANNAYSATTDSTGYNTLTKLITGSYTLSPTFSTTQTNAVFVPPVRLVEITSGMTMTRLITGQNFVRWHRYPVTGLITGELITEAVVSASSYSTWQATTAEVGATGHYTFANLLAGRYSFTATHADYQFVSEDPLVRDVVTDTVGPTFTRFDSSGTYTISGQVTELGNGNPISDVLISIQNGDNTTDVTGHYTFTGLATGDYNLTATGDGFTFSPKVAEIYLDDDFRQDFEGEKEKIPNIPKGANFLRFPDNTDATDYRKYNVAWNLELTEDVLQNKDDNISSGIKSLNGSGVKTIVRLEQTSPKYSDGDKKHGRPMSKAEITALVASDPDLACDDPRLIAWMDDLDIEYDRLQTKLRVGEIYHQYFILGNEPNHYQDEWNYSGKEYAYVYNCYYKRWKPNHTDIKLYVAGPGQGHAHPEQGEQHWSGFINELFGPDGIKEGDGFTMHTYGYSVGGGDAEGNALFKPWLDSTLVQIKQYNALSDKPFIITEYNPGASSGTVNDVVWNDWFKRSYCAVTSAQMTHNKDIDGVLYFVDEAQPKDRGEGKCTGEWAPVSLCIDDDNPQSRRGVWLNLNNDFSNVNYSPANNSDFTQWCVEPDSKQPRDIYVSNSEQTLRQTNITTSTFGYRHTIVRGEISGTLWGRSQVSTQSPRVVSGGMGYVYVIDDLIVPEGERLVIDSQTVLVFSRGKRLIVAGQLWVEGRVYFTTGRSEGWGGIHFLPSSGGSLCRYCHIQDATSEGVAIQIEAPISLIHSKIIAITDGIAISSTVPFTGSNLLLDQVGTAIQLTGQPSQTQYLTHLTISRCQQGIVNRGQRLRLDNSIITECDQGITTELSSTTTVSYSLFYNNQQNFVTQPQGQLTRGNGLLYVDPLLTFKDTLPKHINDWSIGLLPPESPAVDAADPQADYSQEPPFSGNRADMGAYGNTIGASQRIPYEKFSFEISAVPLEQQVLLGDVVTFTVQLTYTGAFSDSYYVGIYSSDYRFKSSTVPKAHHDLDVHEDVFPYEMRETTIWTHIPTTTQTTVNTIEVGASGSYSKYRGVEMRVIIPHILEENGLVYLEAEEYMRQTPAITPTVSQPRWITQSIITGYVGNGYVTALPDTGLEISDTYTTTSPKLSYTIHFTTPGRYHVWLRGYAADAESDAVYVALDNQAAQLLSGFPKMRWAWWHKNQTGTPITVEIGEGETGLHTFNLWLAEDGFQLDRILLTLEGDYIPAGRGPTDREGNQAHLLPPAVGGFETGSLTGWELPYPGVTLAEGSAYQDQYGIQLNRRGRIDYTFETIPGTPYQVSAWVRLDEVISPPSWGGLLLQAVDIPSWHQLGWSAYLHTGSHPTGQTLPLGAWHYVTFRFEAVGSTSRIIYQNFSDGELGASADEFQVLPLAEPSLLARSSRLLSRSYAVHLPVVRGGTGLSEAVLADRLLAWERDWASGERLDLPVELARVHGVGD